MAATPNERVCLQNCFETGSGGYWLRQKRQLPRAPLEDTAYSFILLVYVFLEMTTILGEK